MFSTRDIINSTFEPRSSGGIIMTSKEEYKKRFDLVVKELRYLRSKEKYITFSDDYDKQWISNQDIYEDCYSLKCPSFTKTERKEMQKILRKISRKQLIMRCKGGDHWGWRIDNSKNELKNVCCIDFHEAYRFYRQCKEGEQSAITLYKQIYHDKCKSVCPILTESKNRYLLGGEGQVRYRECFNKYQIGYRVNE